MAGRVFQFWAEEEDELIREGLQKGLTYRNIAPSLPHRNQAQIENRIRTMRRRRDHECIQCCCKLPEDHEYNLCLDCKDILKDKGGRIYAARKAKGICTSCGKNPADASLTMCEDCLIRSRSYTPRKVAKSRNPHQGLIRWIGSPSVSLHVRRFPRGHKVVDLFGGSAAYTAKAASEGLHAAVYNDTHPGLVALVGAVQDGKGAEVARLCRDLASKTPEELAGLYRRATSLHREGLAAVTLMIARSSQDKNLRHPDIDHVYEPPRELENRFRRVGRELQRTEVVNLDFAEAIDHYDSPDTFFFCDPPYPGTAKFEHNMTGRHEELGDRLARIRGKFFLVNHSSRVAARLLRRHPFAYRSNAFLGPLRVRELIATNYKLEDTDAEPMDWASFGM